MLLYQWNKYTLLPFEMSDAAGSHAKQGSSPQSTAGGGGGLGSTTKTKTAVQRSHLLRAYNGAEEDDDDGMGSSLTCVLCCFMVAVIGGLGGTYWYIHKNEVQKLPERERTSGTMWTVVSVVLTLAIFAGLFYQAYAYKRKNEEVDRQHQRNLILWNIVKISLMVLTAVAHMYYYKSIKQPDENKLLYEKPPRRAFSIGWKLWSFFVLGVMAMAMAKLTIKLAWGRFRFKPFEQSPEARKDSKRKSIALLNPHEG